MQIIKSILSHFDMFTIPATLRTQGKGSTGSYFTGFISTILSCFFIYLFYEKAMAIFQFKDISSIKTFQTMATSQPSFKNLMFAIGMDMNVSQLTQYFHIYAIPMANGSYNETIQFEPCRPQRWHALGEQYEEQYRISNLDNFLCPESTQSLNMKNVKFSPGYNYIKLFVQPCNLRNCLSWIYPPLDCRCKSQRQIQKYILSRVEKQNYIGVWIKLLDQVVHTESEDPIHQYVNQDIFLTFTKTRGQIAFAQFATFLVITDVGVTPIKQIQFQNGHTLDTTTKYVSYELNRFGDPYVSIQFSMSRKKHKFYRSIGKIDRAFSYVGGTISLLVTIIAFFVKSYNQFRYQLRVAQYTFNYNEEGDKVREKQFNLLKYAHYSLVSWCYVLFLVDINTQQFKQIDQTRDEIGKQLSVQKIFKKIQVLQGSVNFVMKDNYKYFLNLTQPPSIQTVRYRRLITQYFQAVVQGQQQLTLEDFGEKKSSKKGKYAKLKRKNKSLGLIKLVSQVQKQPADALPTINRNTDTILYQNPNFSEYAKAQQNVVLQNSQKIIQKLNEQTNKKQNTQQKTKKINNGQKAVEMIVNEAILKYPSIKIQAQAIVLNSQLKDTQMFLSQVYTRLKEQQKYKLCQKIPVKIIYRILKIVNSLEKNIYV